MRIPPPRSTSTPGATGAWGGGTMIPARRYGTVSAQLRVAAVAQIRALAPRSSSRWRAICLVADAAAESPNTLPAGVIAAGDPPPARQDDPARTERERALQLAPRAEIVRDLSHALHTPATIAGAQCDETPFSPVDFSIPAAAAVPRATEVGRS